MNVWYTPSTQAHEGLGLPTDFPRTEETQRKARGKSQKLQSFSKVKGRQVLGISMIFHCSPQTPGLKGLKELSNQILIVCLDPIKKIFEDRPYVAMHKSIIMFTNKCIKNTYQSFYKTGLLC